MGEYLSARVSHLEMNLNGSSQSTNMKCSGLCVCTGTGSTSWNLSINRLPTQSVAELLRLLDIESKGETESLAKHIADVYNKNLVFLSGISITECYLYVDRCYNAGLQMTDGWATQYAT